MRRSRSASSVRRIGLTPGDFAALARKVAVLNERDPNLVAKWVEGEAQRRKSVSIRSHAAPLFCRSVGRQHKAEDDDNEDQELTKLLSPYLTFDDLAFLRRFGRFIGHAQRDTSFQARIRPACLHRNQADDRFAQALAGLPWRLQLAEPASLDPEEMARPVRSFAAHRLMSRRAAWSRSPRTRRTLWRCGSRRELGASVFLLALRHDPQGEVRRRRVIIEEIWPNAWSRFRLLRENLVRYIGPARCVPGDRRRCLPGGWP
jgi:hypothetical protein